MGAALEARGTHADHSSVFRGLTRLADDGVLERMALGDGKVRFEGKHRHHEHVQCSGCGAVSPVPGCLVEGVVPKVEGLTGWHITGHRLIFSGLCGKCATVEG